MKHSEALDKLAPALCKAQAEMGGAVKDSQNPFFKSKYADLTSVWRACKDALHSNGLSVIQSPNDHDGRMGVSTMLLHTSGQFVVGDFTLGVKKENNPQEDGSSITYARRYALAAFVGLCPVDDDAELSMRRDEPATPEFCDAKQYSTLKQTADALSMSEDDLKGFVAWYMDGKRLTYTKANELIDNYQTHLVKYNEYLRVEEEG